MLRRRVVRDAGFGRGKSGLATLELAAGSGAQRREARGKVLARGAELGHGGRGSLVRIGDVPEMLEEAQNEEVMMEVLGIAKGWVMEAGPEARAEQRVGGTERGSG